MEKFKKILKFNLIVWIIFLNIFSNSFALSYSPFANKSAKNLNFYSDYEFKDGQNNPSNLISNNAEIQLEEIEETTTNNEDYIFTKVDSFNRVIVSESNYISNNFVAFLAAQPKLFVLFHAWKTFIV